MSRLLYMLVFYFSILQLCKAQRKILDGRTLSMDRSYVVYLIKADSKVQYDAWICGGAIVSNYYIVTSAACVEDVKHMYAIAGYSKYVSYPDIDNDACTRDKKKKIVYICLPSEYQLDYPKVERWANIDIALVKVEVPYDFNDGSYNTACSYIPSSIEINYDKQFQEPGINAIVFGWGHTQKWRAVGDTKDYNQDNILYGAVQLAEKEECKKDFEGPITDIIDKYMVCSIDEGALDDQGGKNHPDIDPSQLKDHCGPGTLRMGDACVKDLQFRRNNENENVTGNTRRKGICQNDHGGPLITWRGPKEILIGLASVFKVQAGSKDCVPPFLYTSTYCNSAFLNCLLNDDGNLKKNKAWRRKWGDICEKTPEERGFHIIRRSISWIGHPDGPAENEYKKKSYDRDAIYEDGKHNVTTRNAPTRTKGTEGRNGDNYSNTPRRIEVVTNKPARRPEEPDDNIEFSDILNP